MVSGFVTSPDDQSRICFDDARPIRIASKSLMSIKFSRLLSVLVLQSSRLSCAREPGGRPGSRAGSLLVEVEVGQAGLGQRADLLLRFLRGALARADVDLVEVAQRLVGGERQLAVLVDALLALLDLLGRRLPRGRAERSGREVDPELLRR